MPGQLPEPSSLLPFALLLIAVLGLWIQRSLWIAALTAAVVAAYFTGALAGPAALWIALLGGLALAHRWCKTRPAPRTARWQPVASGLAFFLFALAMGLLLLPGFPRTVLVETVVLSPGALPYSIGLGFPKVVAGIFVLGLIHDERVRSWGELGQVLWRAVPVFLATVGAVMALALAVGYVRFDPKWTPLFLVWAPVNLLFTCLAEEAFFRGFVQRELSEAGAHRRRAAAVALGIGALLFGLVHFGGGWKYVAAATLAGVGYGVAYQRTRRIEGAMAVHFGVNAVHFLLFTYPAAASG
jgi:membrane protease YdiL (CAAX protease family)